jgi:hypothetical protein
MPISTFPRHDYDEDEYLLKPAGLRDTHSEGKVINVFSLSLVNLREDSQVVLYFARQLESGT